MTWTKTTRLTRSGHLPSLNRRVLSRSPKRRLKRKVSASTSFSTNRADYLDAQAY